MDNSSKMNSGKGFGRYELGRLLAVGGMGEVYLATSQGVAGFEKRVVIKKILPHLAQDETFVKRFIDEARLVVQLNHANIVQVLDMGRENNEYFIAMEFVDGLDLRGLRRTCEAHGREMPLPLKLHILAEISAGLQYAHGSTDEEGRSLGIVHRDVSPSNVMLSRDGAVKLVDFGVAKATTKSSQSLTGSLRGKVQYMSPEQATGEEVTSKSDVFALGVMAYEWMTGFRPFDADTDIKTLDLIRKTHVKPIAECGVELPVPVALLIESCLSRECEERPSAENVRRDLLGQIHEMTSGEGVTDQDLGRFVAEIFSLKVPPQNLSLEAAFDLQMGSRTGESGNHTATVLPRPGVHPGIHSDIPSNPSWPSTEITAQQTANVRSLQTLVRLLVGAVILLVLINVGVFFEGVWSESGPESGTGESAGLLQESSSEESVENPGATQGGAEEGREVRRELAQSKADRRVQPEPMEREERILLDERLPMKQVHVSVLPPSARISVDKGPWERGSKTLDVPLDKAVRVSAREKGYRTQTMILNQESSKTVRLKLVREATGKILFRFFPANAKVLLDGKVVNTENSNLVERELVVGEHVVEVITMDGARRMSQTFRIRENEQEQLGTLKP